MNRQGFCAYGAEQLLALLPVLEQPLELEKLEVIRGAAVRLQACLTLFAPCFPPTRLAFWKRRLRRLIRALNALRDHQRLLQLIPKGRVRLRLQQRIEMQLSKAQQAWQRIQSDYVLNEIRGLSQRLYRLHPQTTPEGLHSTAQPSEIADYARARWQALWRTNLKSLESGGQNAGVRWGRLQLMLTVAQMLAPLLPDEIPLDRLQACYQQLDAERFRERARTLLTELKEQERQLTLHYRGSLRGFRPIERGVRRVDSATLRHPLSTTLIGRHSMRTEKSYFNTVSLKFSKIVTPIRCLWRSE
jgi:hypothetical protein